MKRPVILGWLVLPFAMASPLAMASTWSAPIALQPNVDISASAVDVAGGHTIVAWEGNTGVWAAISRSKGGFAEQRLSRFPVANVATRVLMVDSRGDAVIAWETRASLRPDRQGVPPGTLFVAYRPAGGRFGAPHRVARGTQGADLGIDSRGDVTIVWRQAATHQHSPGLYVTRRLRSGRYGLARRIISGHPLEVTLAVNGADDAALVWEQGQQLVPALLCSTALPGSGFGPPVTLVDSHQGAGPFDAGIDAAGRVTVAWEGPYDGASTGTPYAAVNVTTVDRAGTAAGPTERLQDPGGDQLGDTGVRLVVDRHGDAAAVWDTQAPRIVVARRSGQGPFEAPQVLGTGDVGGGFDVAIGPTGALAVAWESHYRIKTSLAPGPTESLQRPTTVSPPGQGAAEPAVAVLANGQSRIAWQSLGPDQPQPGGSSKDPLLLSTSRGTSSLRPHQISGTRRLW